MRIGVYWTLLISLQDNYTRIFNSNPEGTGQHKVYKFIYLPKTFKPFFCTKTGYWKSRTTQPHPLINSVLRKWTPPKRDVSSIKVSADSLSHVAPLQIIFPYMSVCRLAPVLKQFFINLSSQCNSDGSVLKQSHQS